MPTNKAKDWAQLDTIKKETRKVNLQAYQKFRNDIIAEDTTTNLWWLLKKKRCDTAVYPPLKRNRLTFSKNRVKADILIDQFYNFLTREDLDNLKRAPTQTSWPVKIVCTSCYWTWTHGKQQDQMVYPVTSSKQSPKNLHQPRPYCSTTPLQQAKSPNNGNMLWSRRQSWGS